MGFFTIGQFGTIVNKFQMNSSIRRHLKLLTSRIESAHFVQSLRFFQTKTSGLVDELYERTNILHDGRLRLVFNTLC